MLQFQDLTKRLVVACSLAVLVLAVLLFAYNPVVAWCVAAVASIFAGVALWEFVQLTPIKGNRFFTLFVVSTGVAYMVLFFLVTRQMLSMHLAAIIALTLAYLLFFVQFKTSGQPGVRIAFAFFGLVYVIFPIALMLKILFASHLSDTWGIDGRLFLLFLIVVTKMTDIGGYFAGRLFGKVLLAPRLSPKKTWEGAIIGWVCSVLMALVLTFVFKIVGAHHLSYKSALILGAILGLLAQLGDLAESLFKREAEVKDSNKLPGIGGALDTLDSLLFTAPVLALYLFL